ncbi:uncharacterized protein LOC129718142 [Wyeomyia smithii]|uniref:uncharacterized protein LOC129718142 n=1 Tax=Wyeomyia smithii TaxID=174621 RepID=UPI002467E4EE|nr:uncharacterized protein LOC129718142 [Wyeomyia smithii]
MKNLLTLLLVLPIAIVRVRSLECYSCDSDLTDLDCNQIDSLPKVNCTDVSGSSLVALTCGLQHARAKSTSAERIYRGCMVVGECDLLTRQVELTSAYRMAKCHECSSDHCNDLRTDSGVNGQETPFALVASLLAMALVGVHGFYK